MKKITAIVALMCAIAFQTNAQNNDQDNDQNNAEELQKEALKGVLEFAKEADEHPEDGRKQYLAAFGYSWDALGDKMDLDRALTYANRALEIANSQTVLKDTLKGLTCLTLGSIYLKKRDIVKSYDYLEMGLKAIEEELGRYNPATIAYKISIGFQVMTNIDPRYGSIFIQQAFLDNERTAPENRLKNMENISAVYDLAIEFLMADITNRMWNGLPIVPFEGKHYIMVETPEWNIEQPVVGWLVPKIRKLLQGQNDETDGDIVLFDIDDKNAPPRVIKADAPSKPQYNVYFFRDEKDPHAIVVPDESARLMFIQKEGYDEVLAKYREFKKKQ